ncbi:hypothetical protein UB51_16880 [Paenibacillus sp. IHBB 10380]|nr:hypothetical protein UB51_16880 [Paenibacillus sp. IHBB 10380]
MIEVKDKIKAELEELLPQIKKITLMINAAEEDWTTHYDRNNPEDLYLQGMFYLISNELQDGGRLIGRALTEVNAEGVLKKKPNGRYGFGDVELTTGEPVEYLLQDPEYGDRWILSRIDHNGENYYLWNNPGLPLEGLRVRIKWVRF